MNDETRERLLQCAEQLFAERGLGAVSLREINKAAGQRNTSAIHYHFGSKDALIQSIFEKRMREINARRSRVLNSLESEGRTHELPAVLEAIILPLAEGLEGEAEELNYIIFFGQVLNEASDLVRAAIRAPFSDSMHRAGEMVSGILDELPPLILQERMVLATEMIIRALAQRARLIRSEAEAELRLEHGTYIANLIDFTCGALRAPVSSRTEACFKQTSKSRSAKGSTSRAERARA